MNRFKHIYCINLAHRTDRWAESLIEFSKAGITVERFEVQKIKSPFPGLNDGQYGCLNSHLQLLFLAKANSFENIVIFEDDIEFSDNFNESLKHIPEQFDMLYFGGSDKFETSIHINEHISKISGTYCTHAYIVNHSVYDLLISELNKMAAPIDVVYSKIQSQINCFGFRPKIAFQRESYSDILGKNIRYKSATNELNPTKEW